MTKLIQDRVARLHGDSASDEQSEDPDDEAQPASYGHEQSNWPAYLRAAFR